MEKSSGKTDNSVKAGLELAADTNPDKEHIPEGATEKDVDDLVHERRDEIPDESVEQDMDNLVHQKTINTDEEYDEASDIDSLIHEKK